MVNVSLFPGVPRSSTSVNKFTVSVSAPGRFVSEAKMPFENADVHVTPVALPDRSTSAWGVTPPSTEFHTPACPAAAPNAELGTSPAVLLMSMLNDCACADVTRQKDKAEPSSPIANLIFAPPHY